jgi:CDP-diacylglycerol--serine O-phosphatidyltransferase
MVFDGLDGYAARLSKSASDFGGQLDSLCDAISFGAAPAFLLLRLGQDWKQPLVRQSVAAIAGLYVACAVLRLARFNLENSPDPASHRRFKGLPSPAAAGCLASLAFLRSLPAGWTGLDEPTARAFVQFWTPVGAPMGALVVALLMVSRLPYPHLTKQLLRGRRSFRFVVQIVLVVFVITLAPDLALFLLFWGYALHAPVRYAVRALRRDRGVDLGPTHSPSMD